MFIILIAALGTCLIALVVLSIVILTMVETHNTRTQNLLDLYLSANERLLAFIKKSTDDINQIEEGHKEIIDNYEQDYLTLLENEERYVTKLALLKHQRDVLFESHEEHRENCLPQATRTELADDVQEIVDEVLRERELAAG